MDRRLGEPQNWCGYDREEKSKDKYINMSVEMGQ
jgi:hypothetical protein